MTFKNSVSALAGIVLLLVPLLSASQEMRLFRIGTGGVGGTYYPVGTAIARTISQPPETQTCTGPAPCGVPGLVAVAQTANGSVANVKAIGAGVLESGFSQSDVAYWAYSGTGIFEGAGQQADLRAIAGLYPETVHVVAAKKTGIRSIRDLRDKRVSLDEPGSGTLVDARLVLEAYGLSEDDIEPQYIKPELAVEKIETGELDAFFIVAGHPVTSVQKLAMSTDIVVVPIEGRERDDLVSEYGFFSNREIGSGVYAGAPATQTISVHAIWVTRLDIEEDLVYDITRTLWEGASQGGLSGDHAKIREISLKRALDGVAIPFHPGAEKYYREKGLLH